MSRQARLIVVLAGMALLAVVALGVMAERYSRIAAPGGSPEAVAAHAADRQVDRFVRVRTSLRAMLDDAGLSEVDETARRLAFAKARERALAAAGMDASDYREMRDHYGRWKRDPARLDAVWREALDRRGAELERCDLGPSEELDG